MKKLFFSKYYLLLHEAQLVAKHPEQEGFPAELTNLLPPDSFLDLNPNIEYFLTILLLPHFGHAICWDLFSMTISKLLLQSLQLYSYIGINLYSFQILYKLVEIVKENKK